MAIIFESARFLLSCRRHGVSFQETLTLGRSEYFLIPSETRRLLREHGLVAAGFPDLFAGAYPGYAEPFWRALGAGRLETLDASPYEGATLVHDLNQPVPEAWRGKFSVVCDAGTLEHVYDFPRALRNCLELLRPGGHFLALTGANNHFGHGLYQFSPELYYRALGETNGCRLERMFAVELGWRHRWFEVIDPARAGARVTLINRYPVMLFVQARRLPDVPLAAGTPQQSDYVAQWSAASAAPPPPRQPGLGQRLLFAAPRLCRALEYFAHARFNPAFSFRNRRSFRPVDPRQL